jgi:hypothetical protein
VPLFGPRKVIDPEAREELVRLRDELVRVESVVRQFETEVSGMHDQVRRWMRRAVAAERAVERNQEPHANGNGPVPSVTPASPAPAAAPYSRLAMRGARARMAMRRKIEAESEFLRSLQGNPASPVAEAPSPDATPTEGA